MGWICFWQCSVDSLGLVIAARFAVGWDALGLMFFQICGVWYRFFWLVCGFGVLGLWFGWFSGFGFCVFVVFGFDLLGLLFWVVVLWCCLVWFGWVLLVIVYDVNLVACFDL